MPKEKARPRSEGNHFNIMRLGFALLVLFSHAPELIDGDRKREILTRIFHTLSFGEFAVGGFFFISGYLITQSWDRSPSVFDFLLKRVLRIYPGFIVATLVSVILVGYFAGSPNFFSGLSPTKLVKSILILGPPETPAVFSGLPYAGAGVNGALWTIQYEFRCYLLVLILGYAGILKRRKFVAALLACSLVLVFFPRLSSATFPKSWLLIGDLWQLIRFLCFFLSGAICYLYKDRIALRTGVAVLLIPLLGVCMLWKPIAIPSVAILGGYITLWLACLPLPALDRITPKIDISYGVYLYGWPTQELLCWYLPGYSPWFILSLSIPICCIFGTLSSILVEQPFLRIKSTIKSRAFSLKSGWQTRASTSKAEPDQKRHGVTEIEINTSKTDKENGNQEQSRPRMV